MDIWDEVLDRLGRVLVAAPAPEDLWIVLGVVVGMASVLFPPLWRLARTVVTVVHELGHGLVGMLCGRRFTGLVVNSDMSGHTLTRGPSRGVGLVFTTAAGYPAPMLSGAALVVCAGAGRGGGVLLLAACALLIGLLRSRSVGTFLAMILLFAAAAGLWWVEDPGLTAAVVAGVGTLLLVGGWRQLVNVALRGDRRQDPGLLAAMTHVPAGAWILLWTLIGVGATWWVTSAVVLGTVARLIHAG